MQYVWTLLDLIPKYSINRSFGDLTQAGLALLAFALVGIFLVAYTVAKISSLSIYVIDHTLRFLWTSFQSLLPAILVVALYHWTFHAQTRTPEQAVGYASQLWESLWKRGT